VCIWRIRDGWNLGDSIDAVVVMLVVARRLMASVA